jgi:beta-carotene 15,15'-dioxygenase
VVRQLQPNPKIAMDTIFNVLNHKSFSLKIYLLLFGAILVVFHNYIFSIPVSMQWFLFVGTMLITGIPHGAIDHLVDEQNVINSQKSFSMFSFLVKYVSKMMIYALIWWFFPVMAITIFIGISAFHFGETDLLILPKHRKSEKFLFLAYGWVLLNLLFFTHQTEVVLILKSLPRFLDGFTQALVLLLGKYKIQYFSVCGVLFLIACANYCRSKNLILPLVTILIQGVIILFICAKLPFLLAFAFYFGIWHSLLCFQSIRQYLIENQQLLAWENLAKKALKFSLIAIFGILFFIVIGNYYSHSSNLLFWLFIGIAVLTAPHMEVMSGMFDTIKTKANSSLT